MFFVSLLIICRVGIRALILFDDLLELGCPKNKLSKLGFYGYENKDVLDPYFFNGFEGFEKVYTMIEDCTIQLINNMRK